jgi:hypothetical protein
MGSVEAIGIMPFDIARLYDSARVSDRKWFASIDWTGSIPTFASSRR